ncbi:MAG: hypothetical protein WC205_00065 [Opitutaceae bacterium]|jgi:hypothetical protein
MSSAPAVSYLIVKLSAYCLQVAVVSGGRVVAHRECAPADGESVGAFLAEHAPGCSVELALLAPSSGFAGLLNAGDRQASGTATALLERAAGLGGAGASAVVCDVVNGRIPVSGGNEDWLLAGAGAEAVEASRRQLVALGLTPAAMVMALPAELGALVALLRDAADSRTVAVWVPGESDGQLWRVSSAGIRAVNGVAVGFVQVFEAVQAELGLKFRTAATKLFFNDNYSFDETADRIGGRVGGVLLDALTGEVPAAAFHVVGLPAGQAWMVDSVAKSLGLPVWTPPGPAAVARFGAGGEKLSSRVVGLLQVAMVKRGGEWLPAFLTSDTVIPVAAVQNPAPAPALVRLPEPVRVNKPIIPPASVVVPAPVKAAAPVSSPAPAPEPAPKPVKQPVGAKPPAAVPAKPVAVQPPEAATAPVSMPPGKKFPLVPVLAGVVAVGLLAGGAALYFKSEGKPSTVAVATPAVVPAPEAGIQPSVLNALLESEVKRDSMSFKGDNYEFKVSNKGVVTDFKETGRTSPWVRNLGFMRLYGVSMGSGGQLVVRRAGDMSSPEYQARVVKQVRDGMVVFDIDVSHPKFLLTQTIMCRPRSLKVKVLFRPTGLSDANGPLDAIYGVHFDATEFSSPTDKPKVHPGELVYATKQGPLYLHYDSNFKGAGAHPVMGDPALASFTLAVAGGSKEQGLTYEVSLP